MGRKPRVFLPLAVGFFEDDRIAAVGDGPTSLYLELCLYAKRLGTDGVIAKNQVSRIPRPDRKAELEALADVGLVALRGETWVITGWLKHNASVADQEARREIDRFRKELPDELRREIYARDGYRCLRCGTSDNLTIDHIVPISLGGTHRKENLQTLCGPCNFRKGDRLA